MAIISAKFHVINHKNMDLNVFLEDVFYHLIITDYVTGILLFLILLSSLKKRAVHYYDQAIYLRNNSTAPNPSSTTFEKKRIQNTNPFSKGNKQARNIELCDIFCPLSMYSKLGRNPLLKTNPVLFADSAVDPSRPIFYRFLAQFVPGINLMVI